MRLRWTFRLVAGSLVAAVALSGCAQKQEASTTLPSLTTLPSVTSSSTFASAEALPLLGPPDFPVPADARTADAAGAEAALRYYLALITHQAARSGQPLRDLSRDCGFCTFVADRADQDAAAGNTRTGGEITVEFMSPPAVRDGSAEFAFSVGQAAIAVLGPDGTLVPDRQSAAVTGYDAAAITSWNSQKSAWIITQLFFEQP